MSRLAYSVLLGFAVAWAVLRLVVGDWIGAFFSLIVLLLTVALVVAVAGYFVSNSPAWLRRLRGVSPEDHFKQLESEGKALRETYQTNRVVSFEDLNTGCLVYLLDLGDRRLLCLYGQHYYDFEPIEDDPEVNQPRKFPTRNFSLLRRKRNGEILDLVPGADVLEPTVSGGVTRYERLHELGIRLKDGELVPNVSFETVEATCMSLGTRHTA